MDWTKTFAAALALASCAIVARSGELGSPCSKDGQCQADNGRCAAGVCVCRHYHARYNSTTCLESKLLGQECLVNEQCSLRVANSACDDGRCRCSEGFVGFRKHTCLSPAKIGSVCYGDDHCRLWTASSHCEFVIPKLFGKCACDDEGSCGSDDSTPAPDGAETTTVATATQGGEPPEDWNADGWKEAQEIEAPPTDPLPGQGERLRSPVVTEMQAGGTTERDAPEATTAPGEAPSAESKYRAEAGEKKDLAGDVAGDPREAAPVSLGHPCRSHSECRKSDAESGCFEGVCDCAVKANGTDACGRDKTGCGPETFQCRGSGKCISWFFVCDGRNDCPDASDEECSGPGCPELSFRCEPNGRCVSLGALCDGVKNCPNGEDERSCRPDRRNATQGCPEHTFQCGSGECLPEFEFCNATPKCSDGSDEPLHLCAGRALWKSPGNTRGRRCPFECGNGRCRSTAIVCSGRDGCGDDSDEARCSVCRCPKAPAS